MGFLSVLPHREDRSDLARRTFREYHCFRVHVTWERLNGYLLEKAMLGKDPRDYSWRVNRHYSAP